MGWDSAGELAVEIRLLHELIGRVRYRQVVSQQDPPPAGTAIRSRRSAARQSSLRSHNLALVLETIARHGTISRADIAQAADLTRATVSSLTELLLAAGVLEWAPVVADGAVGRPASPVRLARGTWAGLGLEIGANHLCVAVVNLAGEELAFREVRADFAALAPEAVADAVAHLGQRTWEQTVIAHPGLRQLGAMLAVPGIVRGDLVLDAPRLGWVDVPASELLHRAGLPGGELGQAPGLANEATLAASAEAYARGDESFLYVSGGVGVGGALVVDGVARGGEHGFAGEIGHVAVDPHGVRCRCGAHGCLETYAGAQALAQRPPREVARALGVALAGAVNLLDVSTIILGGTLGPMLPAMREDLTDELGTRVLAHPWAPVRVESAVVKEFPGLRGAALAPVLAALSDPDLLLPREAD